MLKGILIDLDGTLLPMDESLFLKVYFKLLFNIVKKDGYEINDFVDKLWTAVDNMNKNNGNKNNEEIFWETLCSFYGKDFIQYQEKFDKFYQNEFVELKNYCDSNPYAKDIVSFCQNHNLKIILATNPVFPQIAIKQRLSFIGLNESDFNYITNYTNSYHTKSQPEYFRDVLKQNNLKPTEVLIFGNNENDDGLSASKVGIKSYMVGKYIKSNVNYKGQYPHIMLNDIIKKIKSEL